MALREPLRGAFDCLRGDRYRTLLAVLSVAVGVAALVSATAVLTAFEDYLAHEVLQLGAGGFRLEKLGLITDRQTWLQRLERQDLTLEDAAFVRAACRDCSRVEVSLHTISAVESGRRRLRGVSVVGATEGLNETGSVRELSAGRFLSHTEIQAARPVTVIGADVARALFPDADALGKTLTIGGLPCRVVGIAARRGALLGESQDSFLWIPITLSMKLFSARDYLIIHVEAKSMEAFARAQEQAAAALRIRRRLSASDEDDFSVVSADSLLRAWQQTTSSAYFVLLSVTAMGLLAGVTVVMNMMLVSVSERRSEIGLRMAVGATRRDVVLLFLSEAALVTSLGGALGVAAAWTLCRALAGLLQASAGDALQVTLPAWAVLVATGASGAVALVAGVYPALRAAAVDPAVALRQE